MGMQGHVLMHPSFQGAKGKSQNRTRSGLVLWVVLVPAGCTCPVSRAGVYCPIHEVFASWTVFFEAAVRPECSLLCFATQGHLNRRDAQDEGLIANQRSPIHQNLSDDDLECF